MKQTAAIISTNVAGETSFFQDQAPKWVVPKTTAPILGVLQNYSKNKRCSFVKVHEKYIANLFGD